MSSRERPDHQVDSPESHSASAQPRDAEQRYKDASFQNEGHVISGLPLLTM